MLVVLSKGYAKEHQLNSIRDKNERFRHKTAKVTAKTGEIVSAKILDPEEEDLIVISKGQLIEPL